MSTTAELACTQATCAALAAFIAFLRQLEPILAPQCTRIAWETLAAYGLPESSLPALESALLGIYRLGVTQAQIATSVELLRQAQLVLAGAERAGTAQPPAEAGTAPPLPATQGFDN